MRPRYQDGEAWADGKWLDGQLYQSAFGLIEMVCASSEREIAKIFNSLLPKVNTHTPVVIDVPAKLTNHTETE